MAMSRWKAVTAAAVALAVAGGGWWAYKKKAGKKGPAMPAEETDVEVTKGDLETRFRELGDIAAKNTIDIASKVSGRIVELAVKEGDRVRAGQKLAVVQPGKTGAEKFLPSEVTAPIDAVVLAYVKSGSNNSAVEFIEEGAYVTGLFESQNPTYLMTLADMRRVIVKLRINEMDILKLKEGMPVEVMVDSIAGAVFPAVVSVISPQAERESRGGKIFRVEVSLDKPDPRLRTGMTARVDAVLEKRSGVLRLPLTGLFEEKGAEVVYLKPSGKGDKPKQAVVKTGMRTEMEIEVLGGLKEGDKVLTEKPVEFDAVPAEELRKAAEARGKGGAEGGGPPARGMRRAMRGMRMR